MSLQPLVPVEGTCVHLSARCKGRGQHQNLGVNEVTGDSPESDSLSDDKPIPPAFTSRPARGEVYRLILSKNGKEIISARVVQAFGKTMRPARARCRLDVSRAAITGIARYLLREHRTISKGAKMNCGWLQDFVMGDRYFVRTQPIRLREGVGWHVGYLPVCENKTLVGVSTMF